MPPDRMLAASSARASLLLSGTRALRLLRNEGDQMKHDKIMTNDQRLKIHMIADGHSECFPLLSHIFHDRYCNVVLKYLIENKITGKEFIRWVTSFCNGNIHVGIRRIAKMHGDRRPDKITDLLSWRK